MKHYLQTKKYIIVICSCALMLLLSSSVYALRCGTHLISEGDLSIEVKKYCGEPNWIDRWYEKLIIGEYTRFEYVLDQVNERWVYNFGPQQFMRYIVIQNNRVVRIDTGDYGFIVHENITCDTKTFSLGMPLMEVKAKCGEPDAKNRRYQTITRPIGRYAKGQATVPIDEWIYNFGPQYFLRILTFSYGELIEIRTGSRGF